MSSNPSQAADPVPVVELRVYNVIPDKLSGMVERFCRFHKPIFARHGIGVQGPWIRELAPGHQMAYVLEFPSAEERDRLWATFRDYPGWGDDIDGLATRRSRRTAVVVLEPRNPISPKEG